MVQFRTFTRHCGHVLVAVRAIPGALVCLAALLAGCSDDPSSPPSGGQATSKLTVNVSTSGADADTGGYFVNVDRSQQPVRVPSNGSVTFSGLAVGSHTVDLTGVALNCVVESGPSVVTISSPGLDAHVDVHVTCSALGTVWVTVATTGTDLDANGYTVAADGPTASVITTIRTGDSTAVLRLVAGRYVFRLTGVAANCDGTDLGSRQLDVASGATATLDFAVVCETPRRLAFVSAVNTANAEIFTIRSDGSGTLRLTNNDAEDTDPAWSPDGTRIAFTSNRDGVRAIYVMNENGSDARRLTPLTWDSFYPAWSPDGTRIAFVSVRDANADVYVMNADGTGELRLTNGPGLDTDPSWSPDGARIAFASRRDGATQIYVMNADGSGVTRFTNSTNGMTVDGHPAWSPDGTRLAFAATRCDGGSSGYCYPAVFVASPPGLPVEVGVGADPAWSPDGRKIAITRFECGYYYYYYDSTCTVSGLGILVPFTTGASGSQQAWDPQLTAGQHGQPAWRP